MELGHQTALRSAQRFLGTKDNLIRLGWGISGCVFLSPDLRTAVKVHSRKDGFLQEIKVYWRLRRLRITVLHGLTIPKLRHYDAGEKVIQMDFVSPPFLLDFAGARFAPPDFGSDTVLLWHEGIEEMFGLNSWMVFRVYDSLRKHGIYYMDFRPSNLKLDGHPEFVSSEEPETDID